ncbi:MAG TPA: sugar phosphate nucleotidyltransferase [Bryobacteraceae bacterium]|nr:sugar phosphate nucleotidyltransferase [Bryobacteraceae bacterium]
MKIRKAVITAAGRNQRTLPLQTLVDRDGRQKPVLRIILDEIQAAQIDEVCIVVAPGDQESYAQAAGQRNICFIEQASPLGYAHALCCARDYVGDDPFFHLVGDHLYVGKNGHTCALSLLQAAEAESCSVSAVQSTRETQLGRYGTVGGQRILGKQDLYRVETVIEKPTPTEAEQTLVISGLRAGHYLCFFGMHVLTPGVLEILYRQLEAAPKATTLSSALAELARREQYLALEQTSRRYDLGIKYGLLQAQLALALSGAEREEVLAQLLDLVALSATDAREIGPAA